MGQPLLDPTESSFNRLFRKYKREARVRNLVFRLSKAEFRVLVKQNCFYCGTIPKQRVFNNEDAREPFIYNGIDRKNNSTGYTIQNCVPSCGSCNWSKGKKPHKAWVGEVLKIAGHLLTTGRAELRLTAGKNR